MGAYSTVDLTREEAISRILERLDTASNAELAEALFSLTANHVLDNYIVTGAEPAAPQEA